MEQANEELQGLYRRLRRLHVVGLVESEAYTLGVHLLAKMAKEGKLELVTSVREFTEAFVAAGHEPIVGAVCKNPFMLIGALQQLHEYVGLRSHFSPDGLDEGEIHFSREPGGPGSAVFGLDFPLYYRYLPDFGFTEKEMAEALAAKKKKVRLPAWFKSTQFKV